jgi:ferritin-like metal-binding protein YciE
MAGAINGFLIRSIDRQAGTPIATVTSTRRGQWFHEIRDGRSHAMAGKTWFSQVLGTNLTLESLQDLLVAQLRDMYSAEIQLVEALPRMEAAAQSTQLKRAFSDHAAETRKQVERLVDVFDLLTEEVGSEACEAMRGLISECKEAIAATGDPAVKDAALIACAQRVEHYEMAGYGCARTFAQQLGHAEVAQRLQQSLHEETLADVKLTQIAQLAVNLQASRA